MKEFIIPDVKAKTVILVGLATKDQNGDKTREYLDELEFLADTADVITVKRFTQRVIGPSAVTYVGKDKLEEIRDCIKAKEDEGESTGMVIFDNRLSARQMRDIKQELGVKVSDCTSLILNIFAMRARTASIKTQVESAQCRCMFPRLQHLQTHLERRGDSSGPGSGKGPIGLRDPGETQLETDRRIVLQHMTFLRQRLAEIDRQKVTQHKNHGRMIRTALAGYTNVGKSTTMNLLVKGEVFAKDKFFTTLDTAVRKAVVDNLPFLLADTVGFIRKSPTDLVDPFKSTLDEVCEVGLLLRVVDISYPNFEEQIQIANQTLSKLGRIDKPSMIIFNKIDNYHWMEKGEGDLTPVTEENIVLDELKETWMAKEYDDCLFISTKEGESADGFREVFYKKIHELHVQKYLYNGFPYNIEEE